MLFLRRFEISRLQVMVMDPNLIPQAANVVIGENLYELKFRVEGASDAAKPQPMDMDPFHDEGGHESRDEEKGGQHPHKPATGGKAGGGWQVVCQFDGQGDRQGCRVTVGYFHH
jgi:hypothetical protein